MHDYYCKINDKLIKLYYNQLTDLYYIKYNNGLLNYKLPIGTKDNVICLKYWLEKNLIIIGLENYQSTNKILFLNLDLELVHIKHLSIHSLIDIFPNNDTLHLFNYSHSTSSCIWSVLNFDTDKLIDTFNITDINNSPIILQISLYYIFIFPSTYFNTLVKVFNIQHKTVFSDIIEAELTYLDCCQISKNSFVIVGNQITDGIKCYHYYFNDSTLKLINTFNINSIDTLYCLNSLNTLENDLTDISHYNYDRPFVSPIETGGFILFIESNNYLKYYRFTQVCTLLYPMNIIIDNISDSGAITYNDHVLFYYYKWSNLTNTNITDYSKCSSLIFEKINYSRIPELESFY